MRRLPPTSTTPCPPATLPTADDYPPVGHEVRPPPQGASQFRRVWHYSTKVRYLPLGGPGCLAISRPALDIWPLPYPLGYPSGYPYFIPGLSPGYP